MSGKRKLGGGGSASDTLNNIKDYLHQNADQVLHKWVSKIEGHPPNTQKMMEFLLDVMDNSQEGPEVAKLYSIVLKKIDYIPISQFMMDFADVAQRIKNKLNGKKFYLVVGCSRQARTAVEVSKNKSNYFMSILFLCMHKELIDNFIDFACVSMQIYPIHGGLWGDFMPDTNSPLVYIDDASLTGKQADDNLYMHSPGTRPVIFAPVYASARAINIKIENILPITSNHVLRSFKAMDIVQEYYERRGKLEENEVRQLLGKLGLGKEEKYLFYTDIKVPDSLSIFPKALFCLKTRGATYSVVTGKTPTEEECDDIAGIVEDGRVLDTVYKQDEWRNFTEDITTGIVEDTAYKQKQRKKKTVRPTKRPT